MNLIKVIKREIFITTLTVIGIAIAFFGLSYAIYFTIDEENIGSVSFGQLSFELCLEPSCSNGSYGTTITGDVYPMNTTEGTSQTPYTFIVTNNATSTMNVKVYAAKEGLSTDYENVKMAGKVQGTSTYSYADLTKDTSVLIDLEVAAGQSKIIEVYTWLDEEASNEMIGKEISVFVNAIGYFKPEDPSSLHTEDTYVANLSTELLSGKTFNYTGDYQEFEAPASGYYFIETWGAQGGNAGAKIGGYGAYTSGYLYMTKGDKYYIYVGGQGVENATINTASAGGYNGGGYGYKMSSAVTSSGGGGATDIRYFGNTMPSDEQLEWNSDLGLNSRIMVAAGGAGAYIWSSGSEDGKAGGALISGTGSQDASQSSGAYFGYAAMISTSIATDTNNSGGGGGYYGGTNYWNGNAGGGSSFISGYAGSNAITSSSDRTHTNNTIHYSGKYFKDGQMKAGVREGNGQVKIKYVGLIERKDTSLDNVRYIKNCMSGSSTNVYKQWTEFQVIQNGVNIAKGKTPTLVSGNSLTNPANATNGVFYPNDNSSDAFYTAAGQECILIDLGSVNAIDELAIWHRYDAVRTYYDNVTYVSSDNSTWTEVIDEVYVESSNGVRINAYSKSPIGYVQDGLLVWYDGILNTGTTRSTTTTTWKNLASSSYDGTITDGTWGDNYLSFNGTSSWVRVGEINNNTFTIENVAKQNSLVSGEVILTCNFQSGGYGVTLYNGRPGVQAYILGDTWRGISVVNAWNTTTIKNVSGKFDGKVFNIWENGEFVRNFAVGTTASTIQTPTSPTPMAVGANPTTTGANTGWLNGNVYSVRIYNRALSDEEIYHNYLIDKERFGLD